MRRVVVAAVAVGIASAGCGASPGPGSERMTSRALAASMVPEAARVESGVAPSSAGVPADDRRAVPRAGCAAALDARNADPLDQLWLSLGRMYGPVLKPRSYSRMQSKAAAEGRRRAPVRQNRT